jgi:hypothetical protein
VKFSTLLSLVVAEPLAIEPVAAVLEDLELELVFL